MKTAYWIFAALLGVVYAYAGGKKVLQSQQQLAPMMGWVDTVPMCLVRCIGAVEIVGVIGLVLPPLTGTVPRLALAAAIGFAALQVLATGLHVSRGEARLIGFNISLLGLAAVVGWLATVW